MVSGPAESPLDIAVNTARIAGAHRPGILAVPPLPDAMTAESIEKIHDRYSGFYGPLFGRALQKGREMAPE